MISAILFDSHCHLNHPDLQRDLQGVLARARAAGVSEMLVIGYDVPSSREAVALSRPDDLIWAAVGIHPHDAKGYTDAVEAELRALGADPRVVAIGEIGLDYYRDLSPRDVQREAFRRQLDLAIDLGKPVVLHHRDSREESYEILAEYASHLAGCVVHCFNDTLEWAQKWLDLGFSLGIGGPITYPKNEELRRLVKEAPRDRILLETDCPYLAPQPYRGKRNEPAYLALVAEEVAQLWETDLDIVASATTANARRTLLPPNSP